MHKFVCCPFCSLPLENILDMERCDGNDDGHRFINCGTNAFVIYQIGKVAIEVFYHRELYNGGKEMEARLAIYRDGGNKQDITLESDDPVYIIKRLESLVTFS